MCVSQCWSVVEVCNRMSLVCDSRPAYALPVAICSFSCTRCCPVYWRISQLSEGWLQIYLTSTEGVLWHVSNIVLDTVCETLLLLCLLIYTALYSLLRPSMLYFSVIWHFWIVCCKGIWPGKILFKHFQEFFWRPLADDHWLNQVKLKSGYTLVVCVCVNALFCARISLMHLKSLCLLTNWKFCVVLSMMSCSTQNSRFGLFDEQL